MSNPEDEKGNGFMQGEKPSGVSRCGVGLRGFESPLPHSPLLSSNSVMAAELGARRGRTHSDSNPVHPALLEEHPCF